MAAEKARGRHYVALRRSLSILINFFFFHHETSHVFLASLYTVSPYLIMASLRQRILGGKPKPKAPEKEEPPEAAEEVRLAPVSKIITEKHHKTRKRRTGFIFFLGGLFGIVAAGFFAQKSDLIEFPELGDLSMDSLMDVLPAGFVRDARDLAVCFPIHMNYRTCMD